MARAFSPPCAARAWSLSNKRPSRPATKTRWPWPERICRAPAPPAFPLTPALTPAPASPMKILSHQVHQPPSEGDPRSVALANDANGMAPPLDGAERVDLHFPCFTDSRASSKAYLLHRRRGFRDEIRATGEVLIDQLLQMRRTGFSCAVLRAGVDAADARRQFSLFPGFYQGDALNGQPQLARGA